MSSENVAVGITKVLNYLWATSGKVDPEKFAIGVDFKSWEDLGGTDGYTLDTDVKEITAIVHGKTFYVIPLEGVPDDTVALVWREEK